MNSTPLHSVFVLSSRFAHVVLLRFVGGGQSILWPIVQVPESFPQASAFLAILSREDKPFSLQFIYRCSHECTRVWPLPEPA